MNDLKDKGLKKVGKKLSKFTLLEYFFINLKCNSTTDEGIKYLKESL